MFENFDNPMTEITENKKEYSLKAAEACEEFNRETLEIAYKCRYSLNEYKTYLNNNVLVIGGSGTHGRGAQSPKGCRKLRYH